MRNKTYKGSVLVYALGIVTFVSILLVGLVQLIASQARSGYDAVAREKAFQMAEACSNEYRWYLAHNTDGHTIEEVAEFWSETDPKPRGLDEPYTWDVKTSAGTTIGYCSALITNATVSTNTPIVVEFEASSLDNPNIKKKIKVRFRRTSWSDYVVLSNEYANFDSNWDIKGRIMSNTGVRFDGISHGRVYAGSSTYFDPITGQDHVGVWSSQPLGVFPLPNCEYNADKSSCVFLGGKKFPVPQKDFAGIAVDLNVMKKYAQAPNDTIVNNCLDDHCYFNVPAGKAGKHLTLRTDGQFDIVTVKDVKNNSNDIKNEDAATKQTKTIPDDGIIFVGGNVWVDGTVDGDRVTIAAGEGVGDIYIGSGNLRYTNRDGTDAVGLIAKRNILLTSEKKNCGADCDDLEIDAAMVAKDGMIGKQDFNPHCCGGGCEVQKNRLDLYGSVVSNKFIEFTASKDCNGTDKVGFQVKNIEYDNFLYMNPPPFFPSDVYYTIDLWNEL
ncbi:MAG: hypothetical protein US63_C0001G0006 [Candidatus Moranbacteria bacterium GW2011_GWC2_37_8]|nr:MAG: hypothetical protein US63_C0001G0006 [Candidatus Moranbacteria bacterium GW2011_GWC2_37_8]KKQ63057.1 MAG: hypothetical protein US82_C0003G0006 [Parcubacteria group bacterium GW2011_GWC1_38_22]